MAIDIPQSILNRSHQDKFLLIFNLPDALKNINKTYNLKNIEAGVSKSAIQFTLSSVTIPKNTIKAFDAEYGGGIVHVASHSKTEYDPLTIKFKIDNRWSNYFVIYEWLNFIRNESEGYFDAEELTNKIGLEAYATNISVVAMDEYQKPQVQWIFTYAFPTGMPSMTLSYTDSKEIECEVSFVFTQMKMRNLNVETKTDS